MEPLVAPGDVVMIRPVTPEELDPEHRGPLRARRRASRVLHRIVEQLPDGTFRTQGDANAVPDSEFLHVEHDRGRRRARRAVGGPARRSGWPRDASVLPGGHRRRRCSSSSCLAPRSFDPAFDPWAVGRPGQPGRGAARPRPAAAAADRRGAAGRRLLPETLHGHRAGAARRAERRRPAPDRAPAGRPVMTRRGRTTHDRRAGRERAPRTAAAPSPSARCGQIRLVAVALAPRRRRRLPPVRTAGSTGTSPCRSPGRPPPSCSLRRRPHRPRGPRAGRDAGRSSPRPARSPTPSSSSGVVAMAGLPPRSFALVLLMLPFLEAALWFGLSGLAGLWTMSSVALGRLRRRLPRERRRRRPERAGRRDADAAAGDHARWPCSPSTWSPRSVSSARPARRPTTAPACWATCRPSPRRSSRSTAAAVLAQLVAGRRAARRHRRSRVTGSDGTAVGRRTRGRRRRRRPNEDDEARDRPAQPRARRCPSGDAYTFTARVTGPAEEVARRVEALDLLVAQARVGLANAVLVHAAGAAQADLPGPGHARPAHRPAQPPRSGAHRRADPRPPRRALLRPRRLQGRQRHPRPRGRRRAAREGGPPAGGRHARGQRARPHGR